MSGRCSCALGGSGKSAAFGEFRFERKRPRDRHLDHDCLRRALGQRQRDGVPRDRRRTFARNDDADEIHGIGGGNRDRRHLRECARAARAQRIGGFAIST